MLVDDLRFSLQRSARRKTMQITVERDGALVLSAPPHVTDERLRAFVRAKRLWIYTKLAEKDRLQRTAEPREFADGEGFLYLGRSYRLKLVEEQEVPLKLSGGRFRMRRDALTSAREHFVNWYSQRAKDWFADKVVEQQPRLEVFSSGVRVQDLGFRWGSCGKGDWLYFHWKAIQLPSHIAEYVVVHELAHLREQHHTPAFWTCVKRAMPDYERRKVWLAEHGVSVEGL